MNTNKRLWSGKRILSILLAFFITFSSLPVYGLEMWELAGAESEEAFREAIRGDALWEEKYPNGLFNFVGTQYEVSENKEFLEIAVARQGGTQGKATVDLKIIDVTAEYGKDYVIRVYENSRKAELEGDPEATPLLGTGSENPTINLGENETPSENELTSPDAINLNTEDSGVDMKVTTPDAIQTNTPDPEPDGNNQTGYAYDGSNRKSDDPVQAYSELESGEITVGEGSKPKSLKALRESVLGVESDRPDWKTIDLNAVEELKATYDSFFYSVPGAQTTLEFEDGEYIKYLYLVPLNDEISESAEQMLFALVNPTGGAVRGEFYMSYGTIVDDEPEEEPGYEFVQDVVLAQNGQAQVTVRRTSGINLYSSVYAGTEEYTGLAGEDYLAGLKELLFTPGMTEQTLIVDILENPLRSSMREFTIALDRTQAGVNPEKAEVRILVPESASASPNAYLYAPQAGLMAASGTTASLQSVSGTNLEKISPNGFTPQKGQWGVTASDFLNGSKGGTAYADGNNLRLRTTDGTAYAKAGNVKLYGVEWFEFGFSNAGPGRSWSQQVAYYKNWWDDLWNKKSYRTEYYSEQEFNTEFTLAAPGVNDFKVSFKGVQNWQAVRRNVDSKYWNSSAITFSSWSKSGNQSTADIGWLRLQLKEYTLKIENDEANVPKFELNRYRLENGKLVKETTLMSQQPGSMHAGMVTSLVGNGQANTEKTQVKLYRSDSVELIESYSNNETGSNSEYVTYVGYEIKNKNGGWVRRTGTSFNLDTAFLSDPSFSDSISSGVITVRPVFEQRTSTLEARVANTEKGYLKGVGENKATAAFNLYAGDVIKAEAVNYSSSVTPVWTAKNPGKLISTDSTGANTRVSYTVGEGADYVQVTFENPQVVVSSNPTAYAHSVAPPVYTVNGTTYNLAVESDKRAYFERMDALIGEGHEEESSDINLSVSLSYSFNTDYPDPNGTEKRRFGNPVEALLTVYKSDGTVRGSYSSKKTGNSPSGYTVTAQNGTFTYSGKLSDLGWEADDYATVILYGSNQINGQTIATRETPVDFLLSAGAAVVVKTPEGTQAAGDIYTPIVIEKANPIESYDMTAVLPAGFTTRWIDMSGDLNGDGQRSSDELAALRQKMSQYGMDLDTIYAKNPITKNLFWGNFFSYIPKFFNPTQISYYFEKAPIEATPWRADVVIKEKYSTVLNPQASSKEMPVKDATIIMGTSAFVTDEYGAATLTDPSLRLGEYNLVRIMHKGYEFFTYAVPGDTVEHTFDTSDVMRPYNFKATYKRNAGSASEDLKLDADNVLVPIRPGETEFKFSVDKKSEGTAANNVIVRIYRTDDKGLKKEKLYESKTGVPNAGGFSHSIDLLAQNIPVGGMMTLSPLYEENGQVVREYPEVDVGLAFSMDLNIINAITSFDTPIKPAVEFIGQMNNRFDLGMNISLDDILDRGTRTGEDGKVYNTRTYTVGYNKDFEKKFGDEAEKEDDEDEGVISKIKKLLGNDPDDEDVKDEVKKNQKEDTPTSSSGGSFNYKFSVSLNLVIEEGSNEIDGVQRANGRYYFSSLVLMATGNAEFDYKYTYVTPIGIPVFASVNVHGDASAVLAIEPNNSMRQTSMYEFDGEGKVSLNPNNYSIYAQFMVNPGITIQAGAGIDYLNVYLEGNAEVDMNFTLPIIGENAASEGSGGLVITARVGIKVLFVQKKWTIYQSERISLFGYGSTGDALMGSLSNPYAGYLYEPVASPTEEEILTREYLNNRSSWAGNSSLRIARYSLNSTAAGNEAQLQSGVYPYPQSKTIAYGDGKLLLLFVDDTGTRDSYNRAQLFYTLYDPATETWTPPQTVDLETDGTWDEAPDAYLVGDKILVTWADAGRNFTSSDTPVDTLSAMNISGRWFDTAAESFGEKFAVTKATELDTFADISPKISYDEASRRLMVYYTKADYLNEEPRAYDNTPVTDPGVDRAETDDGEATSLYGDIVNGYGLIAYRYAEKQPDGTFLWNTTYAPDEGYGDSDGIFAQSFYGQRFLDLAALVDIEETEYEIPSGLPEGEDGSPSPTTTVTTQNVIYSKPGGGDPLIIESDLITYNGLALYAYVMDRDGSRSTAGDREIYLQIYNYEENAFHHPIKLTSNSGSVSMPQFVRTGGITYLYWLSDGDIVYMDITGLIKNNLKKLDLTIDGNPVSLYIVDKSNTTINGFVHKAVTSNDGLPIEDFIIRSNGDSQYLVWTDYVISYKGGLKAGDPGTEDPSNILKERHIFGAWAKPGTTLDKILVSDYFEDGEGYVYRYAPGKGPGTYPESIEVLTALTNPENPSESVSHGIYPINYSTYTDINGYTGVVSAGDPVLKEVYGANNGFPWSQGVQLTHEAGANYSDLDFTVNADGSLRAVYVKYSQERDETGVFTGNLTNRTLASTVFSPETALELGGVTLDNNNPMGGSTLTFSAAVANTGLKPGSGFSYEAFLTKNGEEIYTGARVSLGNVLAESVSDEEAYLLGGQSATLLAAVVLPEIPEGVEAGFRVLDVSGEIVAVAAKAVSYEESLEVKVLDTLHTGASEAVLNYYVRNSGNKPYQGGLTVLSPEGSVLNELSLELEPNGVVTDSVAVDIEGLAFTDPELKEDGSVQDYLTLKVQAGDASDKAVIKRYASPEQVDAIWNVNTFSINKSGLSLKAGETHTLEPVLNLRKTAEEEGVSPYDIVWRTSNAEVASVLPDGTVIALSDGTARISAFLKPNVNAVESLSDGSFQRVDKSYTLPEGLILEASMVVTVGSGGSENPSPDPGPVSPSSGSSGQALELGGGEEAPSIRISVEPAVNGNTAVIAPSGFVVEQALNRAAASDSKALTFVLSSSYEGTASDQRLELSEEVWEKLIASGMESVSFESVHGMIELSKKALAVINAIWDGKSSITIKLAASSAEGAEDDASERLDGRRVYEAAVLMGSRDMRDMEGPDIPLLITLVTLPSEKSETNLGQVVGANLSEDGTLTILPLSVRTAEALIVYTNHRIGKITSFINKVSYSDNTGWYSDAVDFLAARGLASGVGDGRFAPGSSVTRSEVLSMLARLSGDDLSSEEGYPFTDVPAGKWYAPVVQWAYRTGLSGGTGNGGFSPEAAVIRQDLAVFLSRFTDGLGLTLPGGYGDAQFKDAGNIKGYAREAVERICRGGIIHGTPEGEFLPEKTATRGENAQMLMLLIRRLLSNE